MHGRSRMAIDPRIPTMPGRSTSGFHHPGKLCLHQARSAVRCSASRIKGGLHPSKNCSLDGLRHLVPTFLLMDDSANELLCFLVWPLHRQQWVIRCNCLAGSVPYSHYVMRSFPLWWWWWGAYSFIACLSHLIIDHASLSRRSTVPTPNRDTSNIWALTTLFPYIT